MFTRLLTFHPSLRSQKKYHVSKQKTRLILTCRARSKGSSLSLFPLEQPKTRILTVHSRTGVQSSLSAQCYTVNCTHCRRNCGEQCALSLSLSLVVRAPFAISVYLGKTRTDAVEKGGCAYGEKIHSAADRFVAHAQRTFSGQVSGRLVIYKGIYV